MVLSDLCRTYHCSPDHSPRKMNMDNEQTRLECLRLASDMHKLNGAYTSANSIIEAANDFYNWVMMPTIMSKSAKPVQNRKPKELAAIPDTHIVDSTVLTQNGIQS